MLVWLVPELFILDWFLNLSMSYYGFCSWLERANVSRTDLGPSLSCHVFGSSWGELSLPSVPCSEENYFG